MRRNAFTASSGDLVAVAGGWWIRLIWGVTFKPERFRWRAFYGHRLVALRLWPIDGHPLDGRLVGVQWRRREPHDRRRLSFGRYGGRGV